MIDTGIGELDGQVHLYLADPDDWTGGSRLAAELALLSPSERERYGRFRVTAPARVFLTGRALARRVLSTYAPLPAASWVLAPDDHGRPRILGPEGAPPLHFNLTHTDRLVACLVTSSPTCGIDLEALDRRVEMLRVAEHSFCDEEVELLRNLEGEDRRDLFFSYWTLKESYLKARGYGIAMRLDSVSFSGLEIPRIVAGFSPRTGDRAVDWSFSLYDVRPRHRLAVALHRDPDSELDVVLFRARPDALRQPEEDVEKLASSLAGTA